MLAKLRPLVHGATLCGAGGGGFMLLITRTPNARSAVESALAGEAATVHAVAIHTTGLRVRVSEV